MIEEVEALLRNRPESRFSSEWQRLTTLVDPREARAIHLVEREAYADAAVLLDRWLADVEGHDDRKRSHLTFISLPSIERVRLLTPVEATQEGMSNPLIEHSDLVLNVFASGHPAGLFWFALGERETQNLLTLARKLLSGSK